jgi:hypothetical protein
MRSIQEQDLAAAAWADLSEHLGTGYVYALKWDRHGKLQALAGPFGKASEAVTPPVKLEWRAEPDLDWAAGEQWRQIAVLQEPEA